MQRVFKVNGNDHTFVGDGSMPLLWFVRETAKLTGTKYGCGTGICGACTVHLNGMAVRSCSTPMDAIEDGDTVTTIEGLEEAGKLHPVQEAWLENDVAQCGYCQAGQIMSATAFLMENSQPTSEEIKDAMYGNICRCGTYARIKKAIHAAVKKIAGEA